MSIARSSACVASGRPAPRTGPVGVVLVTTAVTSISIFGIAVDAAGHHRGQVGQERAEAGICAGILEDLASAAPPPSRRACRRSRSRSAARGRGASRPGSRCASRSSEPGGRSRAPGRRAARPRRRAPCRRSRRRHPAPRRGPDRPRARGASTAPSCPGAASASTATPSAARRRRHCGAVARGSSGHAASRGLITVPLVDDLARVEQMSRRRRARQCMHVFVPTLWNSSTSSRAASRDVGHRRAAARSRPRPAPRRRRALAASRSATTATMSPTKRTVSEARNGRNIRSSIPRNGGCGLTVSSTSAAVNTCVPGSSRARRGIDPE